VHLGSGVSGHPRKLHRIRSWIYPGANEVLWKYLKNCHLDGVEPMESVDYCQIGSPVLDTKTNNRG